MSQSVSFDRLQAVLFDMDGLIVDTEPIHFEAFRTYMSRFGVDMPETMMSDFIGYSDVENLTDLKAKYKVEEPLDRMVAERRAIYRELIKTLPIKVFPGFWEFSAAARAQGMKQAVVSSAAAEQVEIVLARLFDTRPDDGPPARYFDAIVSGDDVEHNKPAPDVYLEGAKRLSVPPALCLALEDSPPGARSASTAGMLVVAVPNEYTRGLSFSGVQAVVGSLDGVREYLDW